jgi:prepilin-type N-terminal cleavage/methylation domain-containing protein
MSSTVERVRGEESGFTLVEVMIAGAILAVALITLAYTFAQGLSVVMTAQEDTVARQKAREALEDVLTARDTDNLTWDQIANQTTGGAGVFVNGFTSLTEPGADGIVNTTDDGSVEKIKSPGPDGSIGTADDVDVYLTNYKRQIQISKLSNILKQVTVTIQYKTSSGISRQVVVQTDVSPYI